MKKIIQFTFIFLTFFSSKAFSQEAAICAVYVNVMKQHTIGWKEAGASVGDGEKSYNDVANPNTRVFFKRVVRFLYSDPVAAKKYIDSDKFLEDCIKTYRGI